MEINSSPADFFPCSVAVKSALAQSSILDVVYGHSAPHSLSLLPPRLETYKPHFPDSLARWVLVGF